MAEKIKTPSSKKLFLFLLFVLILGAVGYAYLFADTLVTKRLIAYDQKQVAQKEWEIVAFSDIPWFDKLQLVADLEHNNYQMPWSEHIEAVMKIFDTVLKVDETETTNIVLSDFKISLEGISVKWYVFDLRILYNSPNADKPALIDKFEQLGFLENISIKTYKKAEDALWYDFVLTADVINDDFNCWYTS